MRMYTVKAVKFCSDEMLFKYATIVHPTKDDIIVWQDKRYKVSMVSHVIKEGNDSDGVYYSLDYVKIELLKI